MWTENHSPMFRINVHHILTISSITRKLFLKPYNSKCTKNILQVIASESDLTLVTKVLKDELEKVNVSKEKKNEIKKCLS